MLLLLFVVVNEYSLEVIFKVIFRINSLAAMGGMVGSPWVSSQSSFSISCWTLWAGLQVCFISTSLSLAMKKLRLSLEIMAEIKKKNVPYYQEYL